MKVFQGRLVHSVGGDYLIQILNDHVIGFDDATGKVSVQEWLNDYRKGSSQSYISNLPIINVDECSHKPHP